MEKKVLLVDDESDMTELLKTLLEFHEVKSDSFNSSAQAYAALSKSSYDLIVTDLMMPEVDGFELIRRIRAKKGYEQVPVVVLSAKALTDDELKAAAEYFGAQKCIRREKLQN